MRGWAAPELADLVVSELLGSFGDNELSPECLDGARGCLKDPCPDNSRYTELSWRVQVGTVLHGFAGYFETRLYGDVTLSIRPETHSPGLFSWFPIFFPIKVRP
ncbi:Protein arginine N-methyltransferase 5, partial [Lonchura striata]